MALTKRLAEVRAVLAAATLISLQEAVFRVKMQKVEWNLLLSGRIEQRDALFSHEGTKVAMSSYCPIVEVGPLVEKWGRTDLQRPPFDSIRFILSPRFRPWLRSASMLKLAKIGLNVGPGAL